MKDFKYLTITRVTDVLGAIKQYLQLKICSYNFFNHRIEKEKQKGTVLLYCPIRHTIFSSENFVRKKTRKLKIAQVRVHALPMTCPWAAIRCQSPLTKITSSSRDGDD